MLIHKSPAVILAAMLEMESSRSVIDGFIRKQDAIQFYCVVCQDFRIGGISKPIDIEWIDLRSEVKCNICGHNSRARLLIDIVRRCYPGDIKTAKALIFEYVTPLYAQLKSEAANLIGVEFGGAELEPGSSFVSKGLSIQHEDMQRLSFVDAHFDLIIHSDVLEHVPDPWQGMREIYRVLKPGGKCIFACPIYTQLQHRQKAFLDENGGLVFTGEPAYHGDPLRDSGVPVFYEFGLQLLEELENIGFKAEISLYHSILNGYLSNDNPYQEGLMWPIVMVCTKL
jgi:SAM-dependent methyltransferase